MGDSDLPRCSAKDDVPRIDYDLFAIFKSLSDRQERERQKPAEDLAREQRRLAEATANIIRHAVMSFDLKKPAYELNKDLPGNAQLWTAVMTQTLPIDRRARVLEVLLNRRMDHDEKASNVRAALLAEPRLLDELSKSTDRTTTFDSLYPATEAVRLLADDFAVTEATTPEEIDRQRHLQQEIAKWPAETRGRLEYHSENAAAEDKLFENGPKVIGEMLAGQHSRMTDDEKRAFKEGYKKARDTTHLPEDLGK